MDSILTLRHSGVALVLDCRGPSLPRVLHWGADPGGAPDTSLADQLTAIGPTPGGPEQSLVFPLLASEADLWSGRPGISGHRDGTHAHLRLAVSDITADEHRVEVVSTDDEAGVSVFSEVVMDGSGVVAIRHTVANVADGFFTLDAVTATLPIPHRAAECLDLTGRWPRERVPQRSPLQHGTHLRESRRGRTGHDATMVLTAGTPGFSFRSGEVWGVHVGWSGNHVHFAERLPSGTGAGGATALGGGELHAPGEIRLAPDESHTTPWVYFAYSDAGLDGMSERFHRLIRSTRTLRPRPLVLNTWEAVYFDHRREPLERLAERAAEIGVERFVLDDGWFLGRRDDTAGLGDWSVDPAVWPDGLAPLADRVRSLGMEFGLWFEPEMVNPDSELARAHPEWVLAADTRWPQTVRHQLVLDLSNPEVWAYLLDRIDSLVTDIGVAFIKWDHNRDIHEAVDSAGTAGVHTQTRASYALIDAIRRLHPGLEIESCSSGGARIDVGILERADRVWASDTNDALERQHIQRWTGLLVPPELMGSHVGPPRAHTTGRSADLAFRTTTALFAHAGLEWDITTGTGEELAQVRRWAELYKELRPLVHHGTTVRADHPDDGTWLHGVVSTDRREALFAYVRMDTTADSRPARLLFPGLDPDATYAIVRRDETAPSRFNPQWLFGTSASGAMLSTIGLPAPFLDPQQAVLLHLTAT
jgi:alpha-galactosidase